MSTQTSHSVLDIPSKAIILLAHGKKSDAFRYRMLAEVDMRRAMGMYVGHAVNEIHSFCNVQVQVFYYDDESKRKQVLKGLSLLKKFTASRPNDLALYTSAVLNHAGRRFRLETPSTPIFGTPTYNEARRLLPKPLVSPYDEAILRCERLDAQAKATAEGTSGKRASGPLKRRAENSFEGSEPQKRQRKDAPTSRPHIDVAQSKSAIIATQPAVKVEDPVKPATAVDPTPTFVAYFNKLGAVQVDDWGKLLRWYNIPILVQLNAYTFAATLAKAYTDMKTVHQRSLVRTQQLESALANERKDKAAAQARVIELKKQALDSEMRAAESEKECQRERIRREDEEGDMQWVAEQLAPLQILVQVANGGRFDSAATSYRCQVTFSPLNVRDV